MCVPPLDSNVADCSRHPAAHLLPAREGRTDASQHKPRGTCQLGGWVQLAREQLKHRETGFVGTVEGSWPPTWHTTTSADITFPSGPLTHDYSVYTGDITSLSIQNCAYWNKMEENKMPASMIKQHCLNPQHTLCCHFCLLKNKLKITMVCVMKVRQLFYIKCNKWTL